MNTIKKLAVGLVLAVPCLLAAPAVPVEPISDAVETELEASSRRYQAQQFSDVIVCHPSRARVDCVARSRPSRLG